MAAIFIRDIRGLGCGTEDIVEQDGHGESSLAASGIFRPTRLAVASIRSSPVRSIKGL